MMTFHSLQSNERSVIRLGEHDRRTTDDGQHQDIGIVRAAAHEDYSSRYMINDIAVLFLERDVEFTGEFRFDFFFARLCVSVYYNLCFS